MVEKIYKGIISKTPYIEPTATLNVEENGLFDVLNYRFANVNVPIPEGYLKPEGTLEVSIEGTYDVTLYASVKFEVETEEVAATPTKETQTFTPSENKFIDKVVVNPIPSEYIVPNGNIDITNTEEIDVTQYASAQVKDENLKSENIAENVEVLGIVGTFRGGTDTSDATATPEDVLLGKTAYVSGEKIEGTIEDYDGSNSEGIEAENKLRQIFDKSIVRIESQDITGATEIYPRFLKGCVNLESIEFVDTITTIGEDAVRNCTALKEIVLPNSVTTLGANAFRGAISVTNLKISSGVKIIPTYCFANLDALTSLTIPKGVTSLEASAFWNCDVLEEVHWASSIASVYQDAFDYCENVKRLYLTNLEAYFKVDFVDLNAQPLAASPKDGTTQIYLNGELITHLITPSGTTAIPKYAVYNWGSVVEFTGSSGLTSIGRYSMSGMKNLKIMNLPKSLTSFDSTALNNSINIEVVNLEEGFDCAMNLSQATKMTVGSMVSMFNALATITTTKTLQLGTTNLNKLTAEQKKIATDKGWTLV